MSKHSKSESEQANISKLLATHRWCYFIPPQTDAEVEAQGGFIPALVIEGQPGYHMMSGNGPCSTPWVWGKTEERANQVCDEMNARRGYTREDQQKIVLSSMPGNFAAVA